MPRRVAQPIENLIPAVRAVSPEFARVADLAAFGLAVMAAVDAGGYELRKKSVAKPQVDPPASQPNGEADQL